MIEEFIQFTSYSYIIGTLKNMLGMIDNIIIIILGHYISKCFKFSGRPVNRLLEQYKKVKLFRQSGRLVNRLREQRNSFKLLRQLGRTVN
jgi:hypothetical protein